MLDLLQGIRVVSFNHFLFGPMGIQALADLGADVIAIESTKARGSVTGRAVTFGMTDKACCTCAPTATNAVLGSI